MAYKLLCGFSVQIILMSIAEAAITPQDRSYTASVGEDVTFPWVYENEADMFTVTWTYKEPSATLTTSIMFQSQGSPALPSNNNIEHKGNGEITLKGVSESDSGIYYCEVAYSFSSGHPAVTGTATLTVFGSTIIPTTSTSTTSTIPATNTAGSTRSPPNVTDSDGKKIIIGVSVGVVIAVVLAILIGVCCYFKYRNSERKQEHSENKVSYSNKQGQNVQHGRFSNKSYETENRL